MKRRTKFAIIALSIALCAIIGSSFLLYTNYTALQDEYELLRKTLVNQTHLIAELRQTPKNFDNLDELTNWVNEWEINNKPVVIAILNHTFVIAGNDELYSQYWDCDDISEAMQRDALRDKYLLDRVLVSVGGIVLDHAICQAVADNAYYFIEPLTGEIERIARRD